MKHAAPIVIFFVTLAMTSPAIAADGAGEGQWGVSASDREIEEFLRTAEITGIEEIGEGITKPRRLTLQQGDVVHRAIFKDVDIHSNEIAYTNRFETSFHDSYTFEVAAYRLDRLLNINLVPVTVLREVDGVLGSVQLWIENAMSLQQMADSGVDCKNPEQLLQKLMLMYVLDAMIFNIDRNYGNVLVDADEAFFYLIDHSRSFRNSKKLPKLQEARPIPISQAVSIGLRNLNREALEARLSDLLTNSQIKSILKRRDRLIEQLTDRALLPPHRTADSAGHAPSNAG